MKEGWKKVVGGRKDGKEVGGKELKGEGRMEESKRKKDV